MSPENIFNGKKIITLMMSKKEASEKIKNRIELGKKMLKSLININSKEEIKKLDNERIIWSDFDIELLKKLFSNDSISKEYKSTYRNMQIVPYEAYDIDSNLRIIVRNIENCLKAKIHRLESILERIELFSEKSKNQSDKLVNLNILWDLLHPKIVEVSKNRFETKQFADAVEAAFKEINNTVKLIVKQKTCDEYDGSDLMNKAFSVKNPIIVLDDLSTVTGRDTQIGYMQIFSGSMTGIRNPKTHHNIIIDRKRAIHFLFLASLLMFKIDEKK